MKTKLLLLFLFTNVIVLSQESFKKKYCIPDSIVFKNPDTIIFLSKAKKIAYKDFSPKQKKELHDKFRTGEVYTFHYPGKVNGEEAIIEKSVTINYKNFYKDQTIDTIIRVPHVDDRKGYLKFDEEKGIIYVNPWLKKTDNGKYKDREDIYFYKLQNRQTVRFSFNEFTVSAFAIPLKYRFKDEEEGLSEEFSTEFNVNLFIGYSFGKTSFFNRKKVGAKSNTWKLTGGVFFGASTVTLNNSNTSLDEAPLTDEEIAKGLFSFGFGVVYAINKINLGAFYGWDYAIGDDADKWNYNKKPWLGVGIGYELF